MRWAALEPGPAQQRERAAGPGGASRDGRVYSPLTIETFFSILVI